MLLLCWEQKLSSDQKTCLFSLCRGVYCPPIWGDITNHSKDPYWPTTTRQYNEILEGFGTLLASEKKNESLMSTCFTSFTPCELFVICLSVIRWLRSGARGTQWNKYEKHWIHVMLANSYGFRLPDFWTSQYFPSYLQAKNPTIQELTNQRFLACVTGKMAEAPGFMWPGLAHT